MLLYTKVENYKALKVARFLARLGEDGILKAFICFKDEKGQVKSMTYEYGECHQFFLKERTVEKMTAPAVYRTLIRMKKGVYTVRPYGQIRLMNRGQRKRGDR